jgi:hypothetical protein
MEIEDNKSPNPGSKEAEAIGCTCPVMDNCNGLGYCGRPGIFIISGECPLHAMKPPKEKE